MDWVKSNVGLVAGGVVALVLMGLAGWFLYTKVAEEKQVQANLEKELSDLKLLITRNPHPGDPERGVDNVSAVKAAQEHVSDVLLAPYREIFKAFDVPRDLDTFEFKSLLERKIASMHRAALESGTELPEEGDSYSFSFSEIRPEVSLQAHTLRPMAFQLLQIEALTQVLFDAKVHAINGVKRPEVSQDEEEGEVEEDEDEYDDEEDNSGYVDPYLMYYPMMGGMNPQSSGPLGEEYIDNEPVTNDITGAILYPFQVGFQCFANELSQTMSGLNNSDHFFRVRWLTVEASSSGGGRRSSASSGMMPGGYPRSPYPYGPYGGGGYRRGMGPSSAAGRSGRRGELMEDLEEKPLTVNMLIEVISIPLPEEEPEEQDVGVSRFSDYGTP